MLVVGQVESCHGIWSARSAGQLSRCLRNHRVARYRPTLRKGGVRCVSH